MSTPVRSESTRTARSAAPDRRLRRTEDRREQRVERDQEVAEQTAEQRLTVSEVQPVTTDQVAEDDLLQPSASDACVRTHKGGDDEGQADHERSDCEVSGVTLRQCGPWAAAEVSVRQ